jgi:hypothetical protein
MARYVGVVPLLVIVPLIGWLLLSDVLTGAHSKPPAPGGPGDDPKEAERHAMDWDVKAEPVAFDAKRAMGYLEDVCKLGPRMSGTASMTKQQELLEKHFTKLGDKVAWQKFTARQRSVRQPIEMANLIVSWKPDAKRRVILCTHYDTRPIADQDPDPKNRNKPIVSANDGGSGVALLMELAHHMNKLPANVGVDFVFFDGEEYVFEPRDEYFFGSAHFGKEYAENRKKSDKVYVAAILLDMIAGKDLNLPVEQNSALAAGKLVEDVYKVAAQLKAPAFKGNEYSRGPVDDDHVMLNKHGIPAIDLIDFDYKHWHCLTDLPANCSGENMEQVARVLSVWLQRVK